MDVRPPIAVFFGRNGYAPSQITIDFGRAAVATCAALLGGFAGAFIAFRALPWLNDNASTMFHLKGVASVLLPFLPRHWCLDWVEYVHGLDGSLRHALAWRFALAMCIAIGAAVLVWRRTVVPLDGYIHVRGRRLLEGKAALAAAIAVSKSEIGKQPENADIHIHPEVRISADRMSKHGIVFGKVGGGKTTILLPMIAEILAHRHKALIFDIKGDFTSKLWCAGGRVAILAPWDRRSLIWDIAGDCRTRQDAARFAAYLIKESKDPMWSAAARQICVGFLVHLQMTKGAFWGWKDLADLLSTPENELLAIMSTANPEAIRAVEQTGTTTTGILINLSAFLSVIYDLAEAWPERVPARMFCVREWIFNSKSTYRAVLLGGNKEFGPLMTAFCGALVAQAAACVCSPRLADSRSRRIYFILDEFPQIGKIEIEPLVAVGRSKGVRVWLGLQDFGQLKKLYGADTAQAITAMVGTLVCAGAAPGETAKLIADMAGSREVERSNLATSIQGGTSSASTSQSWQRETIPVLSESQVSGLGPVSGSREIRALLLNFGDDALVLRWPFDTRPSIAKPVELAEWTQPTAERRALRQEQAEVEAMIYLEDEEQDKKICADSGYEFDKTAAEAWLSSQSISENEFVEAREVSPAVRPTYVVDAPFPARNAAEKNDERGESEDGPAVERLLERAGEATDCHGASSVGSALLKLAEVADSLRQKSGPTSEQAPPPRRTR